MSGYHNRLTGHKTITMQLGEKIIEADIDYTMYDEDTIYETMRSQMAVELEGNKFIVWDPKHNRKARLHFDEMNPTILYQIIPSHERTQGAGTLSGASKKITYNLARVRAHWNLTTMPTYYPTISHLASRQVTVNFATSWTLPVLYCDVQGCGQSTSQRSYARSVFAARTDMARPWRW
jgi:hypothetical protein